MPSLINREIADAVRGTVPRTSARMRALASVRWVLATDDGRFVTVDERARVALTEDPAEAAVYDARDNEELKVRFMEALLHVPLTVVLLD
jgi:hypothetical protein